MATQRLPATIHERRGARDDRLVAQPSVEVVGQRRRGRVAPHRVLREAGGDDDREVAIARDGRRLALGDRLQQFAERRGRERRAAGQHEVQRGAEPVHVGACVARTAQHLFRRHERGRADQRPTARPLCIVVERLGETEVDDEHVAAFDQQVRRLHVAVHEAPFVCVVQGARGIADQRHGGPKRCGIGVRDERRQRATVDELQAQPLGRRVVDRRDVRMVQPGRGECFVGEPAAQRLVGACRQRLDRTAPTELLVERIVDDAHAAAPDLAHDAEPRRQLDLGSDGLGILGRHRQQAAQRAFVQRVGWRVSIVRLARSARLARLARIARPAHAFPRRPSSGPNNQRSSSCSASASRTVSATRSRSNAR